MSESTTALKIRMVAGLSKVVTLKEMTGQPLGVETLHSFTTILVYISLMDKLQVKELQLHDKPYAISELLKDNQQ